MKHKLYIMRAGDFIKIGVTSRKILDRASEIQTGCPLPIEDIHYIFLHDKARAYNLEKEVHKRFSEHNTYGEWFFKFKRFIALISEVANIEPSEFNSMVFKNEDVYGRSRSQKIQEKIKRKEERKKYIASLKGKYSDNYISKVAGSYSISDEKRQKKIEKVMKNNPHAFKANKSIKREDA